MRRRAIQAWWPQAAGIVALCLLARGAFALPPPLPPGLEGDVQVLVHDLHLPGDCALDRVRIETLTVDLEIRCGKSTGLVQLWPREVSPADGELGVSRSFSIRLVEGSSEAIQAAARAAAHQVAVHDDGTFYAKAAAIRARGAGARSREADPIASTPSPEVGARDLGFWDNLRRALVWAALLILIAQFVTNALGHQPLTRPGITWLVTLGGLFLLALGLRMALPPWAPLHANSHGIAELRGLASAPSEWRGPVETDRYGVAYRQIVRAVIHLWGGRALSALGVSAVASALAVVPLALLVATITGSRAAGALAGLGLAAHPAHIALSPSESPMGLAGTLFLTGLAALCAVPAMPEGRRTAAYWIGALALAAGCELTLVTLVFPAAALVIAIGALGGRLRTDWKRWLAPALVLAGSIAAHFVSVLEPIGDAWVNRSTELPNAPLSGLMVGEHQNALLDSTLAAPTLWPLAAAGFVVLLARRRIAAALSLGAGALIILKACSLVNGCRTDVIRYQADAHLLLFVLAASVILAIPAAKTSARRAMAAAVGATLILPARTGLAAIKVPLLDAQAYEKVQAAGELMPPQVTVHIAPRRMAGGAVINDFPEFLLQAHGRSVVMRDAPDAPDGDGCFVWLGPPCYAFSSAEALAGVPALARHGSDTPFRDECRPLTGRMDASQPPLLASRMVVPFSADEFHRLGDHPLIGLFPCVEHDAGSSATAGTAGSQ